MHGSAQLRGSSSCAAAAAAAAVHCQTLPHSCAAAVTAVHYCSAGKSFLAGAGMLLYGTKNNTRVAAAACSNKLVLHTVQLIQLLHHFCLFAHGSTHSMMAATAISMWHASTPACRSDSEHMICTCRMHPRLLCRYLQSTIITACCADMYKARSFPPAVQPCTSRKHHRLPLRVVQAAQNVSMTCVTAHWLPHSSRARQMFNSVCMHRRHSVQSSCVYTARKSDLQLRPLH